jgi:O-antigen/teichoic acid export membrane protein
VLFRSLALLLTGLGSIYLGVFFKIPAEFLGTARILFFLIGTDVALGFPLSVFGCTLEGYQSFWLLNLTHIGASLLRGLLILLVLSMGGGLIAVALVAVGLNLARHLVCAYLVFRNTTVRFSMDYLDRSALGELVNYSAVAFAIFIAENLRFQSDAIVIGVFLSSAAITYFAIGSKLVEYPASLVISLAQIFTPMASHYDARGDPVALQRVFVEGNRTCALLIFPLCAGLIILGKPLIDLWVGARYLSSYPILLVLIVPRSLLLAQSGSIRILLGVGRQRTLAVVSLLEGMANLGLSLMFVRRWGILGVALGTAIPMVCTSLLFLPHHLSKMLGVPLREFLRQAYLAPLALDLPLVGALLLLRHWFPSPGYGGLLVQVVAGSLIYGIGLLLWVLPSLPSTAEARLGIARLWNQAWGDEG